MKGPKKRGASSGINDHVQVRTECIYFFNSNSSSSSKLWSSFGFLMPGKRRL